MPQKISKIVDLFNRQGFIKEEILINCSQSYCGDKETNKDENSPTNYS